MIGKGTKAEKWQLFALFIIWLELSKVGAAKIEFLEEFRINLIRFNSL